MTYMMSRIAIVLCGLMIAATVIPDTGLAGLPSDDSEGPVFIDYVLPDGDLWTSQDFPVQVWVSDPDGVGRAHLLVLENNTWTESQLDHRPFASNKTTRLDELLVPIGIPAPGLVVNYTFRFKANDTLGNMAITENITTSVYRGEGPIFVDYSIQYEGWGDSVYSGVMVYDADGIDMVQLHIWDPHTGLWSTKVMLSGENPWTEIGENYYCFFSVDAPWDEPPHVYKFRLEANDTLGNSVISSEMSRVYYEIITTAIITTGTGFPLPPEALTVVGVVAGCIAVIVILRLRHRP